MHRMHQMRNITCYILSIPQNSSLFEENEKCAISGWGDVSNKEAGMQHAHDLQTANVKIINFQECKDSYRTQKMYLKERLHICASESNTDSCQVKIQKKKTEKGSKVVLFLYTLFTFIISFKSYFHQHLG